MRPRTRASSSIESLPGLLRYGQQSADEFFISEPAARSGVVVRNHSKWEPLVMLKHFGPNHPDTPPEAPPDTPQTTQTT